ncbi:dihydrolipoamide acetyltransferase family protein [Oceanobacillus sp. Castelsardo]|uniref:dihydrolipoamide acetyltransferase family protein n=1 Tax=Oceanobacillus sp. Castelsardo TaxID=1851204 RepID=UPI000838B700|nr:dihydrolipoamide acetyltransferase family protein [Oceanobacillus sp. Castelsardo]
MYQLKFTDIGEGLHEAEILQWFVKVGEKVERDQPILEVQTDKAAVEITTPKSGVVRSMGGKEGDVVLVGETLIEIELDGKTRKGQDKPTQPATVPSIQPQQTNPQPNSTMKKSTKEKRVKAAPSVRKLARDLGVDLTQIQGSAKHGRIVKEDVLAYSNPSTNMPKAATTHQQATPTSGTLEDEVIPIRGLRKKISENMVQSVYTIPHVTGMEEIHADRLIQLRKELNHVSSEKITFLPFIVKVVVEALKRNPIFNSTIDEENQTILLKKQYNIGIATATSHGLIVPVIHHADQKSIEEIAIEISELSRKAEDGKLSLKEIQGGTFTISNTGAKGGFYGTPIINYPQAAILGIHSIKEKPVILPNREIGIGNVMGMSLSFDHRIIDGQPAGLFMNDVKSLLENPDRWMLRAR